MRKPLKFPTVATLTSRVTSLLSSKTPAEPLGFEEVLDRELDVIKKLRRRVPNYKQDFQGKTAFQRAHDAELLGLAFSGGGIRSATFNLGILQTLAKMKMLRCFDILSTVSGGGYIGSWLAAWISRAGGVTQVEGSLDPSLTPNDQRVRPIAFLREYSNYLTPRLGFLGVDTWTMISIWMRNSFLNLFILAMGGAAILLVPLILFCAYDLLQHKLGAEFLSILTITLFLISGIFVALNLKWFDKAPSDAFYTQAKWIRRLIVLPTFASAYGLSALSWKYFSEKPEETYSLWYAIRICMAHPLSCIFSLNSAVADRGGWSFATVRLCLVVGALLFLYLLLIQILAGFYGCFQLKLSSDASPFRRFGNHVSAILLFFLYPPIAGFAVGTATMLGLARVSSGIKADWGEWVAMSWGTLLLLTVLALVVTIHVGLMGRNLPDDRRELWGRLSAWFFIYAIGFAAVVAISVWGPVIVVFLTKTLYRKAAFLLTWIGTTVAGVLAGKSPVSAGIQARGEPTISGKILQLFLKMAPIVFIVGLLLILSELIHVVLVNLTFVGTSAYWRGLDQIVRSSRLSVPMPLAAFAVCALVAILFSLTVDINEFSMHHFYKNRLVRCYLGASRLDGRRPNQATGFDRDDDQPLATFLPSNTTKPYDGPLPIINATLNLVHGDNLAWQQRKAASFFFSPLFSGFEISSKNNSSSQSNSTIEPHSFRETSDYAYPNEGIHIGTAMAISGAAANPNMGFHSSAAAAFLMTVFDVRLGWWLGNPKNKKTWQKAGPTFGLGYLMKELLGLTNEREGFVNLSDGGHFDNLGVYELVRRRCRFIVACDAEEDHDMGFGGLGNTIRKCREDFGVKIEIDVGQIRRAPDTKFSRSHCVVGKIKYPDQPSSDGVLVYLKSSLTGDEPEDVIEYKFHHPEFPHESTADQWFTESQFESYRQLGYHVAEKAFEPAWGSQMALAQNKTEFFSVLNESWYPPSIDVDRFFTRHAEAYDALIERIRKEPELGADLDSGLFPGINALGPNKQKQRSAFYFCTSLIQLMENVYLDLNLEENLNHPDNAGWVHVFSNWTKSPTFITAWRLCHDTYGTTFQRWCQRNFQLP